MRLAVWSSDWCIRNVKLPAILSFDIFFRSCCVLTDIGLASRTRVGWVNTRQGRENSSFVHLHIVELKVERQIFNKASNTFLFFRWHVSSHALPRPFSQTATPFHDFPRQVTTWQILLLPFSFRIDGEVAKFLNHTKQINSMPKGVG